MLKRNSSIDAARFFFALFVVGIHIVPFGSHKEGIFGYNVNFCLKQGIFRLAVPFFFICNGYFLFEKINIDQPNIPKILRTAKHALKLYLIWTVIYLPMSIKQILLNENGVKVGLTHYIHRLFFYGSHFHLWYLNALFAALLIIGLLLYWKVNPRLIWMLSACSYLFGVMYQSYYGIAQFIPGFPAVCRIFKDCFIVPRNALCFALIYISIGMLIAVQKKTDNPNKYIPLALLFIGISYAELYLLKHFSLSRDYDLTLSLPFTAYFLFMAIKGITLPDSMIFTRMGKCSRLIYYTHLLFEYIIKKISCLPPYLNKPPFPYLTVVFFSVLFSVAVVRLSENKNFKWINNFY